MSMRDVIMAAANAFKPTVVDVPELGGKVFVRPLTLAGLSRVQAARSKDPLLGNLIALIDCLCDENGTRLFSAADEETLAQLPVSLANKLFEITTDVSALSPKTESAPGN